MSVILELSDILVSPLPGVKFTMATDATSKSDSVSGIALFEKSSNIKNVRVLEIGGALGVHTGPGALSVAIQKIND